MSRSKLGDLPGRVDVGSLLVHIYPSITYYIYNFYWWKSWKHIIKLKWIEINQILKIYIYITFHYTCWLKRILTYNGLLLKCIIIPIYHHTQLQDFVAVFLRMHLAGTKDSSVKSASTEASARSWGCWKICSNWINWITGITFGWGWTCFFPSRTTATLGSG